MYQASYDYYSYFKSPVISVYCDTTVYAHDIICNKFLYNSDAIIMGCIITLHHQMFTLGNPWNVQLSKMLQLAIYSYKAFSFLVS